MIFSKWCRNWAKQPKLWRSLTTEPLKVAYFGSDQFSVHSLQKLHDYQINHQSINLHVISRSIKPTGRKLKTFVDLPIGKYCEQNDVKISRADSSQDILNLLGANKFDLAIAVSYGKLIPELFLNACKFGGVNVHPSLLPKYSGSSPIQYALINDDDVTGCTVQTLHPTKFDRGDIILQSGEVPVFPNDNYNSLRDKLGEIGGNLLVEVIDRKLYTEPQGIVPKYKYSLAPKIAPTKAEILWDKYTTKSIIRLRDALGRVQTNIPVKISKKGEVTYEIRKVIFNDIQPQEPVDNDLRVPGHFLLNRDDGRLVIKTMDGYISVGLLKLQYCPEVDATKFLRSIQKGEGEIPKQFVSVEQN